jgi:gliding motility-associated-like protein
MKLLRNSCLFLFYLIIVSCPLFAQSYTLPVVFHIISGNPGAITDQQMIDALKDLNDAFSKSGVYSASTGANTQIQFCLAQKDPDGGTTSGITRTQSFLTNFDQDIEDKELKNLSIWDPSRYINIWYVTDIKSETLSKFSCGKWTGNPENGYATMPPGNIATDGIVVSSFGIVLAHEMGHYLGLYHTFEGLNCLNNNCATDGDHVCDTPPDQSVANSVSCSQPQNSCSSDTLSGFTVDVPDMISNFMDYGNDACHNAFTAGQAARMRTTIATQRAGLLQDECTRPCGENSMAAFTRDITYPVPGDLINFTNSSTGASNFEWRINDVAVATGINFSYSFSTKGKFKVTLKAYNANASCFSLYSDYVIVGCGVTARFYPDKRIIASKSSVHLDSIYFTNRSQGAGAYKWLMSNDKGMVEKVVSTNLDLNYTFANPANYSVRLIASSGTCSDTSEKFNFTVLDPTPDGTLFISAADCYQQNKIKLLLVVCNNGYAPFPPNTPVSFYDADPRTASAHKIGNTFLIPDTVQGKCCGLFYEIILPVNNPSLDVLYAVFNDNGTSIPLVLPNSPIKETNYANNIQPIKNFKYKVSISPPQATMEPGDSLQLIAQAGPGNTISYLWSTPRDISCTNCDNPLLIADSTITKKVVATSEYGCVDSAFLKIKVPPSDDFTIKIDSIRCAKNDSLQVNFTICNGFRRGFIPKGLPVSFYDADPSKVNAHVLGPLFTSDTKNNSKCASFHQLIKGIDNGTIYAVVNESGTAIPIVLPYDSSFLEKDYSNNMTSLFYKPDTLILQPTDTTVARNQPFPVHIISEVSDSGSATWFPNDAFYLSCFTCASPLVTPFYNSILKMEVANSYGCILRGQVTIKTYTGGQVSIANAFTPNRDGRNEVFYILGGPDVVMINEFSIYNRWGGKIFQVANAPANEPNFGWNGTVHGKEADPGTYVYYVKIALRNGRVRTYKGTVTLIR